MSNSTSPHQRIKLHKYRNRRYYDTTRSLHVTLEDIYVLIRDGHDVEVINSQSGEDITPKVLTQIILEYDPLKLGVFPVQLLHQVIRASEPLIREFVDKYFSQALTAYLESQRQFERYLRQALGLDVSSPTQGDWMQMMLWPFGHGAQTRPDGRLAPESAAILAESELVRLRKQVKELREQIDSLKQASKRPES